jgi:hypothetical protein
MTGKAEPYSSCPARLSGSALDGSCTKLQNIFCGRKRPFVEHYGWTGFWCGLVDQRRFNKLAREMIKRGQFIIRQLKLHGAGAFFGMLHFGSAGNDHDGIPVKAN